MNFSPQFGRGISQKQKIAFEKLEHYKKGKFINSEPFTIKMDVHSVVEMAKNAISGHPHIRPEKDIEVLKFDLNQLHTFSVKRDILSQNPLFEVALIIL